MQMATLGPALVTSQAAPAGLCTVCQYPEGLGLADLIRNVLLSVKNGWTPRDRRFVALRSSKTSSQYIDVDTSSTLRVGSEQFGEVALRDRSWGDDDVW